MLRFLRPLTLVALLAVPSLADPAPPFTAPGIQLVEFGVFCRPGTKTRQAAPGTSLGYVYMMQDAPVVAFHQQEIPARLGIHFGVIVLSDRDILEVRAETWKPGATKPEVWFTESFAGSPRARGYMFELPEELVTGIWRMDAFEGETLIYSIEWEVLPASELPGVTSDCDLLT